MQSCMFAAVENIDDVPCPVFLNFLEFFLIS